MAIVHFDRPIQKARRRRGGPLSRKALEALNDRMSKAFSLDFSRGIEKLKDSLSPNVLEDAVRSGNYRKVIETRAWQRLGSHLADCKERMDSAAQRSASLTEQALPPVVRDQLVSNSRNERISDYLGTRTGALIENVTDEMAQNVEIAVRMNLDRGLTQRDIADTLREQLRDSIGLNNRQAQALANYKGPDKAAYGERLLDQRAMMIARTEVSFATNFGQLSTWKDAQDQGLLDAGAKKVWVTDGDPCPLICDPMDGVEANLDDDFNLPDGSICQAPPAHPHCRCVMSISNLSPEGSESASPDDNQANDS